MSEPVFQVQFACGNCGDLWTEKFKKGTKVKRKEYGGSEVRVVCKESSLGHTRINCDECRTIVCPVCDIKEEVTINNRKPL